MTRNAKEIREIADDHAPCAKSPCEPDADLAQFEANGRAANGQFARGNRAHLRHGLRSARVQAGYMPEQAEARAALGDRVARIVADLGGSDAISTLALGQVERHARLELVDAFLWENLQTLGPLTAKGKTRAALSAWLLVVDRLHRSALALGLERRQKRTDNITAIMREHEARA